jgi:hypothetical protein
MCVAHLLSATAGAVLVVQLRCTALACVLWPLAAPRPCIADRPIYVQVHSRSVFGQSYQAAHVQGPCYSTLSVASTMLMLIDCIWTRKCQDLALQQSLSTQRWFTGWPASKYTSTALAVEQGMPLHC